MNGLPESRAQSMPGRSDPPVKPTSEVAHQPGQQLAADLALILPRVEHQLTLTWDERAAVKRLREITDRDDGLGPAVECSAERHSAPETQPVAPAEGRAWETPATRAV